MKNTEKWTTGRKRDQLSDALVNKVAGSKRLLADVRRCIDVGRNRRAKRVGTMKMLLKGRKALRGQKLLRGWKPGLEWWTMGARGRVVVVGRERRLVWEDFK